MIVLRALGYISWLVLCAFLAVAALAGGAALILAIEKALS